MRWAESHGPQGWRLQEVKASVPVLGEGWGVCSDLQERPETPTPAQPTEAGVRRRKQFNLKCLVGQGSWAEGCAGPSGVSTPGSRWGTS